MRRYRPRDVSTPVSTFLGGKDFGKLLILIRRRKTLFTHRNAVLIVSDNAYFGKKIRYYYAAFFLDSINAFLHIFLHFSKDLPKEVSKMRPQNLIGQKPPQDTTPDQ